MSEPQVIPGILVTHGRLGEELVRTAESILGPQPALAVCTNAGQSHHSLIEQIEQAVATPEPVVLFVDLAGGSCGQACRSIVRRRPHVLVAYGVNLPMLVEFLYHRGRVTRAELRARLEQKGRTAVRCVGWETEAGGKA